MMSVLKVTASSLDMVTIVSDLGDEAARKLAEFELDQPQVYTSVIFDGPGSCKTYQFTKNGKRQDRLTDKLRQSQESKTLTSLRVRAEYRRAGLLPSALSVVWMHNPWEERGQKTLPRFSKVYEITSINDGWLFRVGGELDMFWYHHHPLGKGATKASGPMVTEDTPIELQKLAYKCLRIVKIAQLALGSELSGHSPLDLVADAMPSETLLDLEIALVIGGVR